MSGKITIKASRVEAERWFQHLKHSERNTANGSTFRTPPEKLAQVKSMIRAGHSKNHIVKQAHVGLETVNKVKRTMVQEGVL